MKKLKDFLYWKVRYRLKHWIFKKIGIKIDCMGEHDWFGFKWSPKKTASYQIKRKS